MKARDDASIKWLYKLKRSLLFWVSGVLAVFIAVTSVFVASVIKKGLLEDGRLHMLELSNSIEATLKMSMFTRSPAMIQKVLDNIVKADDLLLGVHIVDGDGWVAFSTDEAESGRLLDAHKEPTCRICHIDVGKAPRDSIVTIDIKGKRAHRNIKMLYKEEPCLQCHSKKERVYGKIIIDRSLEKTHSLITMVAVVVMGSALAMGALLIAIIIPFLSKRVDRYIKEIFQKSQEVSALYKIVGQLSKSIDQTELKRISVSLVGETLEADEVDILMPDYNEHAADSWTKGGDEMTRRGIGESEVLFAIAGRWADGGLTGALLSPDSRTIYMPVIRGDTPEALIAARKHEGTFDARMLGFADAMSSHVAAAFENARLYKIAITDELTLLYTVRHFRTCLDRQVSLFEKFNRGFALIMLDIDDFKKINDTYGHLCGDSVLRDAAALLRRSVRGGDLAFRYGGEEFTVLLPDSGPMEGRSIAERIRMKVEEAVFAEGLRLTVSMGVSSCPENALTEEGMVLAADRALYEAKAAGKNRVVVSTEKSSPNRGYNSA